MCKIPREETQVIAPDDQEEAGFFLELISHRPYLSVALPDGFCTGRLHVQPLKLAGPSFTHAVTYVWRLHLKVGQMFFSFLLLKPRFVFSV